MASSCCLHPTICISMQKDVRLFQEVFHLIPVGSPLRGAEKCVDGDRHRDQSVNCSARPALLQLLTRVWADLQSRPCSGAGWSRLGPCRSVRFFAGVRSNRGFYLAVLYLSAESLLLLIQWRPVWEGPGNHLFPHRKAKQGQKAS